MLTLPPERRSQTKITVRTSYHPLKSWKILVDAFRQKENILKLSLNNHFYNYGKGLPTDM